VSNSICAFRYAPGTWQGQHLVSGRRHEYVGTLAVLMELVRWFHDSGARFARLSFRPDNRGTNRLFGGVAELLPHDLVSTSVVDYGMAPIAAVRVTEGDTDVHVRRSDDLQARRFYGEFLPPVELASLALGDPTFGELDRIYGRHGLSRRRHAYVATAGDRLVGACLVPGPHPPPPGVDRPTPRRVAPRRGVRRGRRRHRGGAPDRTRARHGSRRERRATRRRAHAVPAPRARRAAGGGRCTRPRIVGVPDATFDHAWARFFLEHVPDPAATVHELARVVSPGGKVTLVDIEGNCTWHFGMSDDLRAGVDEVLADLAATGFDPHAGRHLATYATAAGLVDIRHEIEPYHRIVGTPTRSPPPPGAER
jgi:Methyltransferase domain